MSVIPGQRLGPYEIVAPIGAGGMGEVYRAKDTKLNRDVAIKVLPEMFAADADRVARFTREAKTLASLNHPNIAAIYAVETTSGVVSGTGRSETTPDVVSTALVMELVEGEDLSAHIARGAMPLADVLPIATQIADALEAAHEQGIVHRDLKPANIKLRTDGTVKVLDFGLAKAFDPAGASNAEAMNSPTLTARATQMGMIIGTAAYMSPEQARGRAVDRRADIWAFGAVLYEMLTGRRAFDGEDISITLAGVLKEDVKWDALPADLPVPVLRLLRRCLEKDPRKRLSWIGEARLTLGDPTALGPNVSVTPAASPRAAGPLWRRALPWALAGVLGVLALLLWAPWRTEVAPAPRKLLVNVGATASLASSFGAAAILSPDGMTLVFVGQSAGRTQMYVRKLDQLQAVPLSGTDGAFNPFFSPTGEWIGFFSGDKLKKVSVTGGASVDLCDAPQGRGGTWMADDTIIFTPNSTQPMKLMRVSAAGGTPTEFGVLGEGVMQRWPQALPDGKTVLYTEHSAGTGFDAANLVVAPLAGGPAKIVVRGGYYARYVPSSTAAATGGHLLYMQQGTLFAVPFDLGRLEVVGQAVPALEGIAANPSVGSAQVSFSSDGTLAYLPGSAVAAAAEMSWMTRDGKTKLLRSVPSTWADPMFSPDGQRVAFDVRDGQQRDIWVYEWTHDTMTQLTFGMSSDRFPIWTPDGKRIAFASDRAKVDVPNLYWMNADGSGEPTRLTDSPNAQTPSSWHPSGKFLAFHENRRGATGIDLMILPMNGEVARGLTPGAPTVFLATPVQEVFGVFSPDGRWLAYVTGNTGTNEVYVRPFPGPGGQWRVSTEGGSWPKWSRASPELLFLNPSQLRVMAAPYTVSGESFHAGKPEMWSPAAVQAVGGADFGLYALHPDGKRLAVRAADSTSVVVADHVVLISNFFAYLDKIAPVKKAP